MSTEHWIAITILLVMLVLGFALFVFVHQYKLKTKLVGKRFVTILTKAGERKDLLLPIENSQVWHGNRPYLIMPEKSFDVWWPLNKSKIFQQCVKSFLYSEGNPEPIDPFDRPTVVTNEVLANLQDVSFSRAMLGRSEEIVGETYRTGKSPHGSLLLVLVIVVVILGMAAIVMGLHEMGIIQLAPTLPVTPTHPIPTLPVTPTYP